MKPDLVDCLALSAQGASLEDGERQLLEPEG